MVGPTWRWEFVPLHAFASRVSFRSSFLPNISLSALRLIAMAGALRRLVQVRFAHHAAASVSDAIPRSAPKVLDSTIKLTAIAEEDGSRHAVRGMVGQSLLKTLVRSGLIERESHRTEDIWQCGAECEVSVAHEWLEKLPPRSEDEMEILEKTQLKGHPVDNHTRLACQIILDSKLDGMAFAVPEARPWKTN